MADGRGMVSLGQFRLRRSDPEMIGRAHDWFNSRRWFIRVLLYAEWVILAPFVTLIIATSV
jgi:hypothetical protein